MSVFVPKAAFDSGVLNKDYHDRLIVNLDWITQQAGIPPDFVWTRLADHCSDQEIEWVRKMREGRDHGLVFVGSDASSPVVDKMMAITGACLRNYMDARVMTVQDVLARLKNDVMPSPTVVLVPNFCMDASDTSNVATWEASNLLGWLYSRLSKNLKTVLYAGSMASLENVYGDSMVKHLKAHYTLINNKKSGKTH